MFFFSLRGREEGVGVFRGSLCRSTGVIEHSLPIGDVSLARRCPLRDPDQSCGTCKWCVSLARPLGVLGGSIVIELASQGGN